MTKLDLAPRRAAEASDSADAEADRVAHARRYSGPKLDTSCAPSTGTVLRRAVRRAPLQAPGRRSARSSGFPPPAPVPRHSAREATEPVVVAHISVVSAG